MSTVLPAAAPADAGDTAPAATDPLLAHRGRIRRARRVYGAALAVALLLLAGIVVRVWATSEIRHVTVHSAAGPAPSLAQGLPASSVAELWRVGERPAGGVPFYGGTVVTWSEHTVTGRDAATGATRWTYTRSDRRLCTVIAEQNRAVAVYAHDANCDEVTTLAIDTGRRAWTRTLTDDGTPVVTAGTYTVLFTTPAQVHAVDPVSGIDRWVYTEPDDCRTASAVLGSQGVLISQRCGSDTHLLLRDPYKGTDEKTGTVVWTQDSASVPVSADGLVSALDPATGQLRILDQRTGSLTQTVTLQPPGALQAAVRDPASIGRSSAGPTELVWLGGRLYSLDGSSAAPTWSLATSAMAAVTGPSPSEQPGTLADAILVAPTAGGAVRIDAATGAPLQTWPTVTAPDRAMVFLAGPELVTGSTSTVAYR